MLYLLLCIQAYICQINSFTMNKLLLSVFITGFFAFQSTLQAACPGSVDFSFSQSCGSLLVSFTNTSSSPGTITDYEWDFGDGSPANYTANPTHTYGAPGSYNVMFIITRSGGCMDTVYHTVDVIPVPVAAFSFAPDNACSGSLVAFTNASSGTGLSYSWNFGDGSPASSASDPTHTFTAYGSGTQVFPVTLTITDDHGCTSVISHSVSVLQQPSVYFFEETNWKHCSYNAVIDDTLAVVNMSPDIASITGYQIDWGDGGPVENVASFDTILHNYTALGSYLIIFTSIGANGCVTVFDTTLFIENTPISGIAGPAAGTNLGCAPLGVTIQNTSTFITSTTTTSINWGDGNTDNLPIGTAPGGFYSHTYTNASCPQPLNQYVITMTVSNVCGISQASWAPVRVYEPPQAAFTHTSPTCINVPVTFYNYSTRNECAANPNSTYYWDFGDGTTTGPTIVASAAMPQQTITHTYTVPGIYTVKLRANNSSLWGCDSTIYTRVITIGDLYPDFVSDTACSGQELMHFTNLSGDTIIHIASYSWSFSPASPSTSTATNPTTTYTSPGSQNATLTVYADNGCSESITKPVYVWHLPNPNFTFINQCEYDSIPFTNTSTVSADGASLVAWSYNFDDGSPADPNANTEHLFPTHGEYWVTLRVTDANGCYNTSSVKKVLAYPKPNALYSTSLACENLNITFSNASSSPYSLAHHHFGCCWSGWSWNCYPTYQCDGWYWTTSLNYEWDFDDGSPVNTSTNPVHAYSPPGTYNPQLIVTNIYGCADTLSNPLVVHINPVADFLTDSVCLLDSTHFINLSNDNSGSAITVNSWTFGDGNSSAVEDPVHLYSNPGTLTSRLIVTNADGCRDTISYPVLVHNLPIDSFSVGNVCFNDSLIPLNVSLPTDTGLAQWIWDYGDGNVDTIQNTSHIYASPGLYNITFTVIDSNACQNTAVKPVRVYELPVAAFGFSTGCVGYGVQFSDSSTITDPLTNGNISNWYWDFGDGNDTTVQNPLHPYSSVGVFNISLIASSAYGCADTITRPITVYVPPVAAFSRDTVCYGLASSFTDLSIPMPASIISWDWDFGDGGIDSVQNPNYVFSNPGIYNTMLTVWDTNGCHNEIVIPVQIDSLPALSFLAPHICFGDTLNISNLSVATQGSAILSWEWDFGDGAIDSVQHPAPHYYATDTSYTITLIAVNDLSCRDTLLHTVNVYTLPSAGFAATQACQGLPVTFADTSSNPIAGITGWDWDFGDTQSSAVQHPVHIYPYPGDTLYNVALVVTDSHGCIDTTVRTIRLNPKPVAGFLATTACSKDTTAFADTTWAGGPLADWNWNFGDGSGTDTVQNPEYLYHDVANPTFFNVTLMVADSNGCRDTVTQAVLLNPQPLSAFSADSVCFGLPTHFNALSSSTGGAVVQWDWDFGDSTGTATGSVTNYTYPDSISHIHQYFAQLISTDANGCRDTIVAPVVVNPLPVPVFSMDTICFGSATPFINGSYSNGGVLTNFLWDFGDGTGSSIDENPTYAYSSYGVFPVTLTVTDINGCVDSIVHLAAIDSLPTPIMNISGFCAGDTTHYYNLSLPNGGSITDYYWRFGDSYYSTLENPVHYYDSAGMYQVVLIVTNARGCLDSVTQSITLSPPIIVDFTFDTVCAGTPVTFNDSILVNTGAVLQSWQWDFGDGNTGSGSSTQHVYAEGGFYPAEMMVSDTNGCHAGVFHLIPVLPAPLDPVLASNDPVFCENEQGYVYVLYNQAGSEIYWYDQPGGVLLGTGDTLWLGPVSSPITVFAENISDNGCHNTGGLAQIDVGMNSLPYVFLSSDMTGNTAYTGQLVTFTASPATYPEYSFTVNGQLVQQSSSNVYITSLLSDGDTVRVSASDGICPAPYDSIIMHILPVPNAFTPDEDGFNDVFVPGLDLEIVNRWGLQIYRGTEGWDGRYKGEYVEAGTYYYIIRLVQPEGGEQLLNGVVTLIRNGQ